MPSPRMVLNHAGLDRLLASSQMGTAIFAQAQDMLPVVRAATPHRSGALAASWRVESSQTVVRTRKGGTSVRAGARIISDAEHAAAVEFGHLGTAVPGVEGYRVVVPGQHMLGALAGTRAARAAKKR
ncbi:HK97 gp10 family phage protein [Actinomyces qiguomingii]|uniref:HK97 gp10 family phage protein n=1 Tax=Actinomyces qiguomingii TaxID=2057800 RepID=UPI000FFE9ED8|nr:HK97 gp10 family phage protein [Actinomyces qiguomingii]